MGNGKSKGPGPGNYNPTDYYTKVRPATAKIGTAGRKGYSSNNIPGPGNYNIEGNLSAY